MKKYLGQILATILLGTSILLGLSFWLNVRFSFNMLNATHWNELTRLQAAHTPINKLFYISLGVAVFLFIFGLYMIFRPRFRNIFKSNKVVNTYQPLQIKQTDTEMGINKEQIPLPQTTIPLQQPPKLNLPKRMVAATMQKHILQQSQQTKTDITQPNIYDSELSEIFNDAGYKVKPNLTIAGFTTNLFAIGTNEQVWFGAVDCDIEQFTTAVNRLKSLFAETLDDVPINLSAFILDTKHLYESNNETLIFYSMDELKGFISDNPNPEITDSERENFDAYSDYIDTIIQYAKNV